MLRIEFMLLGGYLKLILLVVALVSSQVWASETLPDEADTRIVALPSARSGKSLRVAFTLALPATQKLNPYAPSFFAIYERNTQGWSKVKNIKLSSKFSIGDVIEFDEDFVLNSDDSEIALHSTSYRCGKDNRSACYIQAFQGKTKRTVNGQRHLKFVAHATR